MLYFIRYIRKKVIVGYELKVFMEKGILFENIVFIIKIFWYDYGIFFWFDYWDEKVYFLLVVVLKVFLGMDIMLYKKEKMS